MNNTRLKVKKMRMLVFDTETTGLPDFKNPLKYHKFGLKYYGYPQIVQLAWIEYDTVTNELHHENHIIRINEDIPEEIQKIHGITNEKMRAEGENPRRVLKAFNKAIKRNDTYIGHNVDFDIKMVAAACEKHRQPNPFNTQDINERVYCTKLKGKSICNLLTMGKYGHTYVKFPRLFELHQYLFPMSSKVSNYHNALTDVIATFRCAYMMIYDMDICIVNEEVSNLFKKCSWEGFMV